MSTDLNYAKSQAQILRRCVRGLKRLAERRKDGALVDTANHMETEVGYLMDALDMRTPEERQ